MTRICTVSYFGVVSVSLSSSLLDAGLLSSAAAVVLTNTNVPGTSECPALTMLFKRQIMAADTSKVTATFGKVNL